MQATAQVLKQNISSQKTWVEFVELAGKQTNQSLLSLLRSCILLELNQQRLLIGTKNIKVFDSDKLAKIQQVARSYFNPGIQLEFKEDLIPSSDSINVQENKALQKQIEARIEAAKIDPKVLEIKEIFSGSEVASITLIEEQEDV